ncbi:MAG: hypothetical protein OXC30_01650 [Alphaproteobacteria bacterium]|nr:hypothetical protein [Alphaproteobacteria bacterium]
MFVFLFFASLHLFGFDTPKVSDLLVKIREIKRELSALEFQVSQIVAQDSDTSSMPEPMDIEDQKEEVGYSESVAPSVESFSLPSTFANEKDELGNIINDLLERPFEKERKKRLKNFSLRVKDPTLKARSLFFLGEVYYLRNKKDRDNGKALTYFSRSYSLDPQSERSSRTLMRVAQCLAKSDKIQEARSIIQKIRSEHSVNLGFDPEVELAKVVQKG